MKTIKISVPFKCKGCGSTSKDHRAKGLCWNCYQQYHRGKLKLTVDKVIDSCN